MRSPAHQHTTIDETSALSSPSLSQPRGFGRAAIRLVWHGEGMGGCDGLGRHNGHSHQGLQSRPGEGLVLKMGCWTVVALWDGWWFVFFWNDVNARFERADRSRAALCNGGWCVPYIAWVVGHVPSPRVRWAAASM